MSRDEIGKLVGQMEAEMHAAAKELDFERAAALRDEIQDIRLRVLEDDASVRWRTRPRSGCRGGEERRSRLGQRPSPPNEWQRRNGGSGAARSRATATEAAWR